MDSGSETKCSVEGSVFPTPADPKVGKLRPLPPDSDSETLAQKPLNASLNVCTRTELGTIGINSFCTETESEQCKLLNVDDHVLSWKTPTAQTCSDLLLQPVNWLGNLGKELTPSFVFGIIVTYGVSQGMGGALYKIAGGYFWKDEQKVEPVVAQIYNAIIQSVWDWKPVWGLLTDAFPVAGYHRRPYFALSGLLSFTSLLVFATQSKLQNVTAVVLLLLYMLGVTIADVTIDAEVTKKSREKPSLGADIQTLCSMSSAIGAFVGFSSSGFIVDLLGSKNVVELLSICGALFLVLGFILHETRLSKQSLQRYQVGKRLKRTCENIWTTIRCPQVWKPTLFMYISWASSPTISEGKFYWYTDERQGLGFSQEFVGMSFAVGSFGAFLGSVAYQSTLKNCSFRKILLWAQVLVFLAGIVDLLLILRWNQKLHISDSFFVLFDDIVMQSVGRLKWIPQLLLCAKLCPPGIEGSFFALLMAVDNLGLMSATWGGAFLQHILGITRENYSNLWLGALIRNILRLLPLSILFLVPDTDPSSEVIPPELVGLGEECEDEKTDLVDKA